MSQRVNLSQSAPELYKTVITLGQQVAQTAAEAGLPQGLYHLLLLRASQINQCAFCLRLHTRDALAAGETMERISVLPAWRETAYFNDKERAALALVEAITLIADGQVPDDVYAQAAAHLTPAEISAVEWAAILINIWNRIAISSRYPVAPNN